MSDDRELGPPTMGDHEDAARREAAYGATFTCPVCGRTSHNPNDVAESYCGACHGMTTAPPPPGFRWVLFVPTDERRRFGRLLDDAGLEPGADYIIVAGDQEGDYVYDGERFVEAPA